MDYTNKFCMINVTSASNSVYRCANFNNLVCTGKPISSHSYILFITVVRRSQLRKIFNVHYRFVAGR
jgi:hypothetical protein